MTSAGAVKLALALVLASPGATRTAPCAAEIAPPPARDEKRHVDFGPGEAAANERDNKDAFRWKSVVVRSGRLLALQSIQTSEERKNFITEGRGGKHQRAAKSSRATRRCVRECTVVRSPLRAFLKTAPIGL